MPEPSRDLALKKNFVADLKRSMFIIVFIFTLEIIVYFVSMSTYVSEFIR